MVYNAVIRFLQAARSMAKQGMKKEQILDFARREFGKVSELLRKQIDDIFKAKPKTEKKGDVVPIKKKEGIETLSEADQDIADIQKSMDDLDAAEAEADAFSALDKRTRDIAKGDVTGEASDLMTDLDNKMTGIKKAADEMKEIADKTPESFVDFFYAGTKARDPRQGVVRAAASEILNKNKVNIGKEDPIDVFRKMYGEDGLEAVDAVSDSLLDAQSYGEMNTILTQNKLFDLVPKKTYGYDQSIVTAEKLRKAKEQEAKNLEILKKFKPDREPSAHGGIAGNLHLNRTGFDEGTKKPSGRGAPWKKSPFSISDDWIEKWLDKLRKKKKTESESGLNNILKL